DLGGTGNIISGNNPSGGSNLSGKDPSSGKDPDGPKYPSGSKDPGGCRDPSGAKDPGVMASSTEILSHPWHTWAQKCNVVYTAKTDKIRLASSMNGRLSNSVNCFHSTPKRLLISELCIFGFSWAIFRRWPRDQTIKAFMGRLIRGGAFPPLHGDFENAAAAGDIVSPSNFFIFDSTM
uniref:Uncharacterized protein n=1 Tax=Romanomermis culicivorax TaxID=13658 RepID=A0A915J827_ROMCU